MDFFATFADMAGLSMPSNNNRKIMDSTSMIPAWTKGEINRERPIFYYRGNLLMAIRQGDYKMHLWTWTSPPEEIAKARKKWLYVGLYVCMHVCPKLSGFFVASFNYMRLRESIFCEFLSL